MFDIEMAKQQLADDLGTLIDARFQALASPVRDQNNKPVFPKFNGHMVNGIETVQELRLSIHRRFEDPLFMALAFGLVSEDMERV